MRSGDACSRDVAVEGSESVRGLWVHRPIVRRGYGKRDPRGGSQRRFQDVESGSSAALAGEGALQGSQV